MYTFLKPHIKSFTENHDNSLKLCNMFCLYVCKNDVSKKFLKQIVHGFLFVSEIPYIFYQQNRTYENNKCPEICRARLYNILND